MRRPLTLRSLILAIAVAASGIAQTSKPIAAGPTVPAQTNVNPELLQLVIADQWDRGNDLFGKGMVRDPKSLDWKAAAENDVARHLAVHKLLDAGKLKTIEDYDYASLIFQHSTDPSDLMLAHILSSAANRMGGANSWMLAATMDRYLQSIKQPQIFGTQFLTPDGGKTWTMEPYNRMTVTDAERAVWCVIPLAQQAKLLEQYQQGKIGGSTEIGGCR